MPLEQSPFCLVLTTGTILDSCLSFMTNINLLSALKKCLKLSLRFIVFVQYQANELERQEITCLVLMCAMQHWLCCECLDSINSCKIIFNIKGMYFGVRCFLQNPKTAAQYFIHTCHLSVLETYWVIERSAEKAGQACEVMHWASYGLGLD